MASGDNRGMPSRTIAALKGLLACERTLLSDPRWAAQARRLIEEAEHELGALRRAPGQPHPEPEPG